MTKPASMAEVVDDLKRMLDDMQARRKFFTPAEFAYIMERFDRLLDHIEAELQREQPASTTEP